MKRYLVAIAVLAACGAAWADSSMPAMNMNSSGAPNAVASLQTHRITGTVKKVDAKNRTVTLEHEAVPSLNWPAMTMSFKVQDDATLAKVKSGAKIRAEMVQRGKDYVITSVN
ncbi:MAG TPA: copper-binding protein [Casimicrobiaceae bacterium]|nr:copper-binding protein [Casimicrobiaceae bacterium]